MTAEESGGFLFSIDSKITISSSSVSNATASSGAALIISYDSELEVNNSTFSNLNASTYGGIQL